MVPSLPKSLGAPPLPLLRTRGVPVLPNAIVLLLLCEIELKNSEVSFLPRLLSKVGKQGLDQEGQLFPEKEWSLYFFVEVKSS